MDDNKLTKENKSLENEKDSEKNELCCKHFEKNLSGDESLKDQIITVTSNITNYITENKLSPCCIECFDDENLFPAKELKDRFAEMFNKYMDGNDPDSPNPETTAFHYISMLKFEMLCNECMKKETPDHIAEKVFSLIFDD